MTATKTYSEKLRDPRWQRKRLERLELDDWTCVLCGAKDKTLHVHHMLYYHGREPWEYSLDFLRTLCEDCHKLESDLKPEAMDCLREALAITGCHSEAVHELAKFVFHCAKRTIASESDFPNALSLESDSAEFLRCLTYLAQSNEFRVSIIKSYYEDGPWNEGKIAAVEYKDRAEG